MQERENVTMTVDSLIVAGDKDAPPDLNRGPSGRPDDPHMQVDQAGDDHPAPKAG